MLDFKLRGFTCANNNGNTCIATATSTAIPTAFCDGTDLTDSATETFPTVVTVTQTDTASGEVEVSTSTRTMVLFAPMFQLNFQASDLPASTTASTTRPSSTSTSTPSTTSAADDDKTSKSSGGLSSGARVGLGVGIGLGIAFLLAFAGFIYYYRRSRRVQLPLGGEFHHTEVSEAADSPKVVKSPAQVYEMGDYHAPAELPGDGHGGDHGGHAAGRYV